MDGYAATLIAAVGNPKTIGDVIASTARRGHIDAFTIGFSLAADNQIQMELMRFTASGTETAVTAQAKDPASPAASLTAGELHTVEPTYTASSHLFDEMMNQRSFIRIVYSPGRELVTNITADNGFGWRATHASAVPNAHITVEWME
jgi:hypothetical protein